MTIKSSGSLALTEIQAEFGGSAPISLSEYYRNGAYVTSNNTGVPTSGQVSFNQFYNTVRQFAFTISSNVQQADLRTLALAAGWDGVAPLKATVNSGVWLWSDNISVGGLTITNVPAGSILINYGNIIGRGGNGGYRSGPLAQNGGPAIYNSVSSISIQNMSGAFIAGGGGGGAGAADYGVDDHGHGGGGAGGGYGGGQLGGRTGGAGGAINQAGGNGGGDYSTGGGQGGGAGGGGGGSTSINGGGGGGGGRILTNPYGGAGATISIDGGNGGSYNNAGSNGEVANASGNGGGGGGGWGAKGGDARGNVGGAGGAAVSGTTVSLSNSGTVWGAVA